MAPSETLNCILCSSEDENAVSLEENRDFPEYAKKKKLTDSPKKIDECKKQLLKVLLLTNPCIKGSGKIHIRLQKLMAISMLFTVFHATKHYMPSYGSRRRKATLHNSTSQNYGKISKKHSQSR